MSGGVARRLPRTADQANGLEATLADLGQELTIAINLDVPVEEVTERMMARGREDDTEEAIARRLSLYEEDGTPAHWSADRALATVDGLGEEDQVFSCLTEAIDGRMA